MGAGIVYFEKCGEVLPLFEHGFGTEVFPDPRERDSGTPGPACTTTSRPIDCQGGRKCASLVQLSPDVPDWGDS